MKYETKNVTIFNPSSEKLEEYSVEIHLSKRNNNTFEVKIPEKTKLPKGLSLEIVNQGSYNSVIEELEKILNPWNNQALEDKNLRVKKIFFCFNAGTDSFDGITLSNKEFFKAHTPNNGSDLFFDFVVLEELDMQASNNLKRYKKYFTEDGNLFDPRVVSDYRSMEWSQEKEDFFHKFNEDFQKFLHKISKFLKDDKDIVDFINNQGLLEFNSD